MTDSTKDDLQTMADELEGIRDTIRLELHLASMEAKTAFQELDTRVSLFVERVRQRHPERELAKSFEHLRAALRSVRDSWSGT